MKNIQINKNRVEEPMVAYGVSLLGLLYSLNFASLEETRLPGSSIVELQKQTKLSPQEMASVVGVSKSKYYELVQLKDIGTKNLDALVDFATLWKKGLTAFDEDAEMLTEWISLRNSNLGNIKPVELLSTRVGRRALEKAFNRIEYSTYG